MNRQQAKIAVKLELHTVFTTYYKFSTLVNRVRVLVEPERFAEYMKNYEVFISSTCEVPVGCGRKVELLDPEIQKFIKMEMRQSNVVADAQRV